MVRGIVTRGSPFSGDLRANNVGRLCDVVSGESVDAALSADVAALAGDRPAQPEGVFAMPTLSLNLN